MTIKMIKGRCRCRFLVEIVDNLNFFVNHNTNYTLINRYALNNII